MVKITRCKVIFRNMTNRHLPWKYSYEVHIPVSDKDGNKVFDTMQGEDISWAMHQARQAIKTGKATPPIIKDW